MGEGEGKEERVRRVKCEKSPCFQRSINQSVKKCFFFSVTVVGVLVFLLVGSWLLFKDYFPLSGYYSRPMSLILT